ncbi:MAG: UDP-glucose 4-epimerase GalE [Bacillaceae bacterium]
MSILVCGGAGYIGSHTVYELIAAGEKVVIADNFQTGHRGAVHPEAILCEGDIRDFDFIDTVFKNHDIEAVIHFAANSLVGESMVEPLKYFDNNVYGTQVLLQAMQKNNVNKIVFSSTAAVYGDVKEMPIVETTPTNPTNTYGETKLAMEKMMKWCDQAYGMKYVSLRYFNVAGANPTAVIGEDHTPETHLIPLILQVPLKQREHITIFGEDYPTHDGTCIRDYIHVVDLAHAHIKALNYLRAGNESNIFNLGNGNGFTVKEMIDAAEEVTGQEIKKVIGERRAGDPATLIASSEKAQRILGWTPQYPEVITMIEDAWRWHVSKPNGYEGDAK